MSYREGNGDTFVFWLSICDPCEGGRVHGVVLLTTALVVCPLEKLFVCLQVLENRVHWALPLLRNQRSSLTTWLSRWQWAPSTCVRLSGTTPF